VGDAGVILATADGGASWSKQSSATIANLKAVTFTDSNRGWAVGGVGTIVSTTDGGRRWTRQNSGSGEDLYGVSFPDALHGWAVGDEYTILATMDGGATWSTQRRSGPYNYNSLAAVCFPDAVHGWVVGSGGIILATTTGGSPPVPKITRLKPTFGKRGALVSISGSGFGATQGTSSVTLGSMPCTKYVSWSYGEIKCRVPTKAKYGKGNVSVTTVGGTSGAKSFTVKR
jgi:hypothetical protein